MIGEAPMRYLAGWRMQLAKQMLRQSSGTSIQAVAARVGYESEPAFNRAFKRATVSPAAAWRKDARKDTRQTVPVLESCSRGIEYPKRRTRSHVRSPVLDGDGDVPGVLRDR